jgi:hypothetical protein
MPLLPIRAWPHLGRRSALLLAGATVAATVATGVPAVASTAGTPLASAPGAARLVTLVTGDVVSVATAPDGRQQASVVRQASSGPGAQFQVFNLGSDLYVVPESAVPYLGSLLDLSLFDVTKLAASGATGTTVQVTYRSAAARSAAARSAVAQLSVPGITITHRSGTSARGVVTPETGPKFGAALARQWRADHAAATHTTGLFASVARISATAPATSSAQPGFVMRTLTINGINGSGGPDTGDLALIYNVDDRAKYSASSTFINGLTKVSVPDGHYAVLCTFYDFATGTVRLVAMPQFTVAGGPATITMDARKATSAVSVTTPKPATPEVNEIGIGRTDELGQTSAYSFLGSGATSFDVQPTTHPITIGQLHYFVYTRQFAADGSYSYDLEFPTDGAIPANEHYAPQDSDLAAIDSKYPASHPGTQGMDTRFGALPWQGALFGADIPITTPTERTEYYSAFPNLSWQGTYYAVFTFNPLVIAAQYQSAWHTYQPGTSSATTWGGTPAGPRLLQAPIFLGETVCAACLTGTTLKLLGYPFGDNSPEHFGFQSPTGGEGETVSYGVFADNVPVAQGGFLDTSVTMPSSAQTYRIDYDTTRSSPDFLLSTAVQTRWTVPAAVPTGSLPAGWVCDLSGSTSCGVVPLITNSYDLPVSLLGQLPAGATTGQLDLGHLGGVSIAFSSVQVNVSFDSGQTWQPVTVTDQGSGRYGLAFTVPAPPNTDGYGALQVSVRDAAGGTFDQTIQHAFAVGS